MPGTKITLGHPEAHEKLTARLFWKRTSETGYQDAGNVLDYTDSSTRTLVTRARAFDGARYINDEQVDVAHEAYTCKLDERIPAQEQLLKLARQLTDVNQDLIEGDRSATISNIVWDRWFAIGVYNIANVVVTGPNNALGYEEGTDYEIDKINGRIRPIPNADIPNGATLTLLFDAPAITFEQMESQYNPLFYCDLIIEEYNQYSRMWLRRKSFRGYMNITAFPAHTGAFGVYDCKITAAGPVTSLKRPEGQTLPTHAETEPREGPGQSSSSSVNESASSQSESSSSS